MVYCVHWLNVNDYRKVSVDDNDLLTDYYHSHVEYIIVDLDLIKDDIDWYAD